MAPDARAAHPGCDVLLPSASSAVIDELHAATVWQPNASSAAAVSTTDAFIAYDDAGPVPRSSRVASALRTVGDTPDGSASRRIAHPARYSAPAMSSRNYT